MIGDAIEQALAQCIGETAAAHDELRVLRDAARIVRAVCNPDRPLFIGISIDGKLVRDNSPGARKFEMRLREVFDDESLERSFNELPPVEIIDGLPVLTEAIRRALGTP